MSNKIRTTDLEIEVIDLYQQGFSADKILQKIKKFKTRKSVYDILKKHDVETKSRDSYHYSRNSTYFQRIDTKDKAYLLGLAITDGWIGKDGTFGFSSTDQELTELFPKYLQTEAGRGITLIDSKNHKIFEHEILKKPAWQFAIKDKIIQLSLKNLGFQFDKTFNEFIPSIQEQFEPHLLRGIFDGDGCIYSLSNEKQPGLIIYSGSKLLLKQFSSLVFKHLQIDLPEIKPATTIFKIAYYRNDCVREIGKLLYRDSEKLRLIRKHSIWSGFYEN